MPASLFRVYGGVLSDKYGARRVMYWTFGVSVVCSLHPVLSADRIRRARASTGRSTFHLETGLVAFTVIVFVLGFFMSLGKAAVYKHIPVYYPDHVGSVGGLVGMIGGLGGFVLPILFGVLNDLTGRVDELLHGCCSLSSAARSCGCTSPSGTWSRASTASSSSKLPELPEMQEIHEPKHVGAPSGTIARGLAPGGPGVLGQHRAARIARRNLWISIPALLLSFAVWMVWSVVVAKLPRDRLQLHHRPAVLARGAARAFGRDAAHLLLLHGADLRRPAVDHARPPGRCMIPAVGIGYRRAEPGHALLAVPGAGAAVRLRRRQLRLLDGQHLASSSRRRRRATRSRSMPGSAISASASCSSSCRWSSPPACSAGSAASRHGQGAGRRSAAVAAERRLHLGAVHRRQRPSPPGSA